MNFWKFTILIMAAMILTIGLVVSCGDDDDDDDDGSTGTIQVTMIDAPVDDADEVNVTVNSLSVNGSSWVDLTMDPQRINLLELQNNAGVILAEQELAAGDYSEIRLVFECEGDQAPEIVIEGESNVLQTPSGCTSGFKMKGDFTIVADKQVILIIDFDVRKSITETGNGKYMLNPVLRFVQSDQVGNIAGEIDPYVARAVVYAFEEGTFTGDNFDDAANSTIVSDDASFVLAALDAGNYDLVVVAAGYETAVYAEAVEVEAGQQTNLDSPLSLTEED